MYSLYSFLVNVRTYFIKRKVVIYTVVREGYTRKNGREKTENKAIKARPEQRIASKAHQHSRLSGERRTPLKRTGHEGKHILQRLKETLHHGFLARATPAGPRRACHRTPLRSFLSKFATTPE
jgi:hypothetical protein